jgi:regulator of sigma E protease
LLGGILKALFGFTANKDVLNVVGGPVSIGAQGNSIFLNFGLEGILATLAMLSINLGIFNLLPIPALDGGRILILTLQKITGKRNRRMEYLVVTSTFILLILVGVAVMVKDIIHL